MVSIEMRNQDNKQFGGKGSGLESLKTFFKSKSYANVDGSKREIGVI